MPVGLHADSESDDRIDDGLINNSNLPKEYRQYGKHADHYYVGREYIADPNNSAVGSFPVNGFRLLQQVSKSLKLNYTDTQIKSIMWKFNGSVINVDQNNGKLSYIK